MNQLINPPMSKTASPTSPLRTTASKVQRARSGLAPVAGLTALDGGRAKARPAPSGKGRYLVYFNAEPMQRVDWVRSGAPATLVEELAQSMAITKERLVNTLALSRATVDRKVRENKRLSPDETARLLGMARLVGQVEAMVAESGDPTGFDAAQWLSGWLDRPLPALGHRRPAELMDTTDGQSIVSNLLARAQSGAFA
jgi:putative toxin-antitoxin system antitoxin component (TIGR02293 family)